MVGIIVSCRRKGKIIIAVDRSVNTLNAKRFVGKIVISLSDSWYAHVNQRICVLCVFAFTTFHFTLNSDTVRAPTEWMRCALFNLYPTV